MNNISKIAITTFKGIVRDKIFYAIGLFALLFLASTFFLGSISLGNDAKVIIDLGLAGIYLFSLATAIFFGANAVNAELEHRTYFEYAARPVSDLQFLLGKFLGILAGVSLNAILMHIILAAVLMIGRFGPHWLIFWQLPLLVLEMMIVTGLTMLFSTRTSAMASVLFATVLTYIGHSLSLLKNSADASSVLLRDLFQGAYFLFPNLEKFNLRNELVYDLPPHAAGIIYPALYAMLYTFILLALMNLSMKKQRE